MKKGEIYCPECARVIYIYDGKHKSEVNLLCKCGRTYRFDPCKDKIKLINKPERTTSSGARFW